MNQAAVQPDSIQILNHLTIPKYDPDILTLAPLGPDGPGGPMGPVKP